MFRIYFEAGARALADYDKKHTILTDLSNSYSSSIDDFSAKIRDQEEKLAELKDQLYHIKKALIDKECASFYQGKGSGNNVSARVIFTSEENAMLFADLLEKHLR